MVYMVPLVHFQTETEHIKSFARYDDFFSLNSFTGSSASASVLFSGGSDRFTVRNPGVPVHRGRPQLVHHSSSQHADPQAVRLHAHPVHRRTSADDGQLRARVRLLVRPAARLRADAVHHVQRDRSPVQADRRRRLPHTKRRHPRRAAPYLLRGANPQL